MKHASAWKLLPDYLDGELTGARLAAIETHVACCPACEAELASLRELKRRAAELPRDLQPARDLWPAISAAIAARPRVSQRRLAVARLLGLSALRDACQVRPLHLGLRAAAAAGAVAAMLLVSLMLTHKIPLRPGTGAAPVAEVPAPTAGSRPSGSEIAQAPPVSQAAAPATPGDAGGTVDSASVALLAALELESRAVDEEYARLAGAGVEAQSNPLVALFEANLGIVNRAIDEARQAWLANPDSPRLLRILVAVYQAKTALQGRAGEVMSRT
jgi:hypothetical protein